MADNLVQRGGLWHVRLDIPKDVQAAFGNRRILSQSLHTGSRAEAMRLRLPILAEWKAQIQAVRERKQENADRWRESLHDSAKDLKRSLTKNVLRVVHGRSRQYTEEEADRLLSAIAPFLDEGRKALESSGADPASLDQIDSLLRQKLLATGNDALMRSQELNAALRQTALQSAARDYELSRAEQNEAATIIANPKSYKPKSPITRAMLDAWAAHLQTQIKTPKTRDMQINRVQRLSDYLTANGLALNFDSVHRFLDSVSSARQTRANYLWSGRSFWKWATKYHQGFRDQFSQSPCPFDGHELPKQGKAAGQSYVAFTRAEVERLHAQALTKGDTDLANLIALGAYTGARLEELGRLKPEDAILDDKGQPIGFRIKEAKTEAGIREVPLHPAIVPLFVQLVEQAPENDGYLFKGGKNKYGNRLDGLSKRFGRLKSKMGYSELHVFHSIRKTTTTELHQRGVTMEILPYIIGHETKSFTLDVYSAGPSFQQKQEDIYKLEFSLTLPPA